MVIFALLTKIIKNKSELKNLFLIKKSKYFNKKWYLNTYPDIKKLKIDAAVHYLKYGWKEYRDPSPLFSTKQYLMQNKDVENKGINPLVHFEKYGKKENRKIFYDNQLVINSYDKLSENEKQIYNLLNKSVLLNKSWYRNYYKLTNEDVVLHYMKNYATHKPNPAFYSNEYLIMHPDIKYFNLNPLFHYEKHGKYEGRAVSLADMREYYAPQGAINIKKEISKRDKFDKKIVTVLAMFSSSAKIEEYQVYLLKGLKKISDYIIIVADNPIFEDELSKLDDICNAYEFIRHGEYDFGSYKRGYNYLIDNNILQDNDSLLFINDSNYGPVYPFENIIEDFKSKQCDFYGLTIGTMYKIHIQSFFYIFTSKVFFSHQFSLFINEIQKQLNVYYVITNYEVELTSYLEKIGFTYKVLLDDSVLKHAFMVPSKHSYTLIKEYKYPMLKKRVIQGFGNESIKETIETIKHINIDLYNIIINSNDYKKEIKAKEVYMPSKYNLYANYNDKLKQIQGKYISNEKINVIFLVNELCIFSAENLMILMKESSIYNVKLYVIPDVRFGDKEMYRLYNNTYNKLKSKYEYVEHSIIRDVNNESILEFKNVIKGADIVCYPSPYDVSYSLYNPYYAVQQNILSIYISNEYYIQNTDITKYNIDNFSNFWSFFLETNINYNEYRLYGQCEGKNSVVVGYAKMDMLKQYMDSKSKNIRKKIIIAPHYSVDGGVHKTLSLSNFEKYAYLFLALPVKYPEIDFIFRPHPILFTVLKKAGYWGEEKVKKYIEKLTSYENVTYSTEGDYIEEFASSDGIIQDGCSILVEYFYTGKPCCYMLKSEKDIQEKFNELGVKCLEHTYIAYNEHEIINFIENIIIKENDYIKEERLAFAEKEIIANYPNASMKIFEYINSCVRKSNG